MYSGAKRVYYKWFIGVLLLGVFVVFGFISIPNAHAVAGINQQLNFQGRLLNIQGATVADGYYNMQFNIYQDGDGLTVGSTGTPAGTPEWTESYLNNNGGGQGVMVKNGYFSVNLGSITPFGSNVDWNQSVLWLSVNIGNTNPTCTPFSSCSPDGEMVPMKRLSSTPYSLNSGMLNGLTSANFVQLAQGVQTDASTNTSSIFINKTGTGNMLELQASGTDAFTVSNAGDLAFGNNANHTLSVTTAAAGVAGRSLTIGAGTAGTGGGALAGGDLLLQGGTAGGTNSNGGNVAIDAGAKSGSGADGNITIGTSRASTIQVGSTTLATGTQTVNIGNNNTAGSTTNVTIGSGSAAAGTTTIRSRDALSVSSSNSTVNITAPAGTMTISSSGNSSLAATAGTMGVSGSGATTLTSTGSTVGISSSGNTTIGTNSATRATFATTNNLYLGSGVTGAVNPFTVSSSGGTAGVAGSALTVTGGIGGSSSAGGALNLQGGAGGSTSGAGGAVAIQGGNATAGASNGGDLSLNAGTKFGGGADGNINIGNLNTNTIQVGNTALSAGIQAINIGSNNTAGGTTNVTIGSGTLAAGTTTIRARDALSVSSSNSTVSITAPAGTMTISSSGNSSLSATAGTMGISGSGATTLTSTGSTIGLSSSGNTTLSTNSVVRATLDTANNIYFGNGVTAATPNNFTISGTGSSTTAVAGGTVTVQGGNATVGSANGGNLVLSGGTGVGTGVNGIVVINTPTFSTTANDANCYTGGALVATNCTFALTSVNNSAAILVGFSATSQTATLPDPTLLTAGRVVYITAANTSKDFTLSVNGGGVGNTIAMRQNTTATMIWNGTDWTAAGASSSTTLQSAYDNTLTNAGGAELVLSNSSNANGLTIRDNATNPINGALLEVQTSTAGQLFSVNNNTSEYAKDGGAETGGGTSDANDATFPATTWSQTASGSTVTRTTTTINANAQISTGMAAVSVVTTGTANAGAINRLSTTLTQNMSYNVSFASKLLSTSNSFQDLNVYYSIDGTARTTACTNYSTQTVQVSAWSKVNCTFTVPAGAGANNSIIIVQNGATPHTFYIDNLSVSLASNVNYATDGSVNDSGNFATNWTAVGAGATASYDATVGNDTNNSAKVTGVTAVGSGLRNRLSIVPFGGSTLYRITAYAYISAGTTPFSDFTIRYSPNAGSNFIDCKDYNTQTVSTVSSAFTKITCYITTDNTAVTTPYVYFVENGTAGSARTFNVDTFSMNLTSNTVPNVQIGGGLAGSPLTLFTVDRGASAPIAANNDALLGSMYYDTTLGKLQCYESDGWGACGSSPDNVITISPEYTNAVLHGTGVGTMTSDLCSDTLNINDGSSSQPTICGTNETYNFYKWTSPQSSAQTYSIYVTYQLPTTFKAFASGQTSLMARTDNGPTTGTGTVQYTIYRNTSGSALTQCGSTVTASTGTSASWATVATTGSNGAADPSACGFIAGNSIVFKIDAITNRNANAYIGNLNFIFNNK